MCFGRNQSVQLHYVAVAAALKYFIAGFVSAHGHLSISFSGVSREHSPLGLTPLPPHPPTPPTTNQSWWSESICMLHAGPPWGSMVDFLALENLILHYRNRHYFLHLAQQVRNINPILEQCWTSVVDGGPTLVQYWGDEACLMVSVLERSVLIKMFKTLSSHHASKYNFASLKNYLISYT